MPYAEPLKKSWRACWYVPGKKTPEKLSGFATKREAKRYAEEQEAAARRRGRVRSDASRTLFRDWATEWYNTLDLEPSSMANYRSIVENHLLPRWGEMRLRDLQNADTAIAAWARGYRGTYAQGTIDRIVGQMRRMCVDAVSAGLMTRNPMPTPRNRGRIAPKRKQRREARYEATTDALGAWLIAERAATLSGRDDDFVLLTAKYWLGLRWSEVIGLEKLGVSSQIYLTHQLHETPGAVFYWKAPKDGSERLLDVPPFLVRLLRDQASRVIHPEADAEWCPCGDTLPPEYRHTPGIHLFSGHRGEPHTRNNLFRGQYFLPAARGLYYAGEAQQRPVLQRMREDGGAPGVFDAVPAGRGQRRPTDAVSCWAPICPGMKVHGFRHSHRALLEELGIPKVLMDERLGHADHSVSARYSHVTAGMRERLVGALQSEWERTVERRRVMGVGSPVGVVEGILGAHSRSTPDVRSRLQDAGRGRVA